MRTTGSLAILAISLNQWILGRLQNHGAQAPRISFLIDPYFFLPPVKCCNIDHPLGCGIVPLEEHTLLYIAYASS